MKTIYKYPIALDGKVEMPIGAVVLTAREQDDNICIWAQVDTLQAAVETRTFQVFGTGNEIPTDHVMCYFGTVMFQGGALVFHVFEKMGKIS